MAVMFSRRQMFNIIVSCFMGFIAIFSIALFPNTATLHPTAFCESLQQHLPNGFSGIVAVINNWTFGLFYCFAELWGDVCLSLLFWSLANEITSLKDAAVIYPLFGIGANVAQVCAGQVLKAVGTGGTTVGYVSQMQSLCTLVLVLGGSVMLFHEVICRRISSATIVRGSHDVAAVDEGPKADGTLAKDIKVITLNVKEGDTAAAVRSLHMQVQPQADEFSQAQPPSNIMHQDENPAMKTSHKNGEEIHTKKKNKKKAMSFQDALR